MLVVGLLKESNERLIMSLFVFALVLLLLIYWSVVSWIVFFFQAEDGIRDYKVTGVQTCALPISAPNSRNKERPRCSTNCSLRPFRCTRNFLGKCVGVSLANCSISGCNSALATSCEIGRASCRERV